MASPNNGKISPKQRSTVRITLATVATLMTLVSAQMFASSSADSTISAFTSTNENSAVVTAETITSRLIASTDSDDSDDSDDNDDETTQAVSQAVTITPTQTQPTPRTHSSR